jgi:hypothetical protein
MPKIEKGIAYPIEKTEKKNKPPILGFFQWLNNRSDMKRQSREKAEKKRLVSSWNYRELLAKSAPEEFGIFKDIVEIEKKNRKELGLV